MTVDELREALEIMLDVVEAVNGWRTSHELEILIADPRGGVSISNEQIEIEILKLCENLYTQNINALLKIWSHSFGRSDKTGWMISLTGFLH